MVLVRVIGLLEQFYPQIANGITIGTVVMSTYFITKQLERMERRHKLADMLGVEVVKIAELIKPIGMNRAAIVTEPRIPVETYRGLVSSGGIANFDVKLQKKLHEFYGHGGQHRIDAMNQQIKALITMIERFRRKNSIRESIIQRFCKRGEAE